MRYKRWNLVKIQRKKRQKFMVMLIIAAFLIVPFYPGTFTFAGYVYTKLVKSYIATSEADFYFTSDLYQTRRRFLYTRSTMIGRRRQLLTLSSGIMKTSSMFRIDPLPTGFGLNRRAAAPAGPLYPMVRWDRDAGQPHRARAGQSCRTAGSACDCCFLPSLCQNAAGQVCHLAGHFLQRGG